MTAAHGDVRPLVTFLSDFGTDDTFVGLCRAAVLAACPAASVIDLTHAVAPQDVLHGAARLEDAVAWLEPGAVHLAVVDPGVGTARRPVVLAAGDARFVGPDNGLLVPAAERLGGIDGAWALPVPPEASATFHGRDLFAPAAGRLAAGADPGALGTAIDPAGLVRLRRPSAVTGDRHVVAPVRDVDRYGNVQLGLRPTELPDADPTTTLQVRAGGRGRTARRVRAFGDLEPGGLGVLEDAFGWVAVVREGADAGRELAVGLHDWVTIEVVGGGARAVPGP